MFINDIDYFQCKTQGRIFEFALYTEIAPQDFVMRYMNSDFAAEFDLIYSNLQGMGAEYDFEEFCFREKLTYHAPERSLPLQEYNTDVLYWIGYLYRYWHLYTGESSKQIYAIADFNRMSMCYLGLHCLDCSVAVDMLRE